jgi:hypothetical protein
MEEFTENQIKTIREIVRQELKKHDEEEEEDLVTSALKEFDQMG